MIETRVCTRKKNTSENYHHYVRGTGRNPDFGSLVNKKAITIEQYVELLPWSYIFRLAHHKLCDFFFFGSYPTKEWFKQLPLNNLIFFPNYIRQKLTAENMQSSVANDLIRCWLAISAYFTSLTLIQENCFWSCSDALNGLLLHAE